MKSIPLTQDQLAWVSDEDYERIRERNWFARWSKSTRSFYAMTNVKQANGKWETVGLHRFVMGLEKGDKLMVDHVDHDTLLNTRENLRTVTHQESNHNTRKLRNCRSKFKGVYFDKHAGAWRAAIMENHKRRYLGYFKNDVDAAKAYDGACKILHGEYGVLNFKDCPAEMQPVRSSSV